MTEKFLSARIRGARLAGAKTVRIWTPEVPGQLFCKELNVSAKAPNPISVSHSFGSRASGQRVVSASVE